MKLGKLFVFVFLCFCQISLFADELYWTLIYPFGYTDIRYPSAETACSSGIKLQESKADLSRYRFRTHVHGNFYRGGSYVSENFGKVPGDPGFDNSSRTVTCSHEKAQNGLGFWSAGHPAGAEVRLQGEGCAEGQVWNAETFGCQNPTINLGGPTGENNSCDVLNAPFTNRPINIITGNKFYRFVDYQYAGKNTLQFVRYYNSMLEHREGWSYSYKRNLKIEVDLDRVVAKRDDGKEIQFHKNSIDWVGPSFRKESLVELSDGFELTLFNNTVEVYDSLGKLKSILDIDGRKTNLIYSADQITVSQINSNIIIKTDGSGRLSSITTPDELVIEYIWETGTNSRLLQVLYPGKSPAITLDNDSQNYEYSEQFLHHISRINDGEGNVISEVEYDLSGRAIRSQTHGGIDSSSLHYDIGESTTVTNALGKQTTYHFSQINDVFRLISIEGHQSANCAAANKNYTYYPSGLLETKTDWKNNTTSYQYNTRNLESSRTEALGTPQERTIITEWHPTFNLRIKVAEPGRETNFIYDSDGRLLSQSSNELAL